MKPTETPVFRPTASCIWQAFRSSGKRHLILTGTRGAGKTTLLHALFRTPVPGITTHAVPREAVYLTESAPGVTVQVGRFDPNAPGHENRMNPCPDAFLTVGVPALERLGQAEGPWVSIDEIGYLESSCPEYQQAIGALLEKKQVAAVVRKQPLPFLTGLCRREDVFLVDLDAPYGKLGCVIMASGMGRRFGGNKLMADFLGQPMIASAIYATEGIFSRRLVVTRHEDVAALCRELGIDVLLHRLPLRSDTVRLGLSAMEDISGCLFCPGDQPLLRQETVAALALSAVNGSRYIWRPAAGGSPGAPVLFPAALFPALLTLPDGTGGGYVIRRHPELVRLLPAADPHELQDADDPETLRELEQTTK